jgi:signal transduction histidine kinase
MVLPIMIKNQAAGIVSIERNIIDAFSKEDFQSATTLINHCAPTLTNSRLYHGVQAANHAKSEFISLVSHELKNPLTSIKGYADLLLSGLAGKLSGQQTEFVETIHTNVKRMNRLILDLTDVSRIDTGQLSVKPERMPIGAVISETITTIQAVADKKNIKIHLEMLPHSPIVYGDQERLVQVMTNLMSNACKYSPENSNVYISLTNGGNQVRLAVKDEGFGISPEDRDKMFTRFFRSEDPNIRQAPGTGLGLSISRAIVERHGGELGFESELGAGTEFWFTVPLAE